MAVFLNLGCYFGFMQISAHKLKAATGALLHLANQTPPIGTIRSNSNTPNMRKYTLRNTATSINTGCPRMFYTMFQKNIENIKSAMSLIIILEIECLICAFPTVKISFTYLYPLRCDMVSFKIDE